MGFDISIIRITNQQLVQLEACAARLHEENRACNSICEAEIYEQADDVRFEQVSDKPESTGNAWFDAYLTRLHPVPWLIPVEETISFNDCQYASPVSPSDQAVMIGMPNGELPDNPLLLYFLPFEAYYDHTDHTQLTTSAPFEAYYATNEPINYPSSIDINGVCEQVSAVLDQRKCPNLGYIDSKDIDPKQDYYALSANLESWEPVEQCMETLVAEQKLADWPIKIFIEADDQAACIGDFQIGYSKLYLLQAVEVPLYLQALKRLPRKLMPFFCWELLIVDKLLVLLEQAARDQDALVWYTW